MLQKFIKNIKTKPEPIRKSITLGASLGITGIVGFFWLISFLNYSSEVLLSKPKADSPTSFLNKMGSLIGESYANVRSKIDDTNPFVGDTSTTSEAVSATTSSITADIEVVATTTTNVNTVNNTSSSVSLQDILTTKKQDNQENKATTSSEVLVQ